MVIQSFTGRKRCRARHDGREENVGRERLQRGLSRQIRVGQALERMKATRGVDMAGLAANGETEEQRNGT